MNQDFAPAIAALQGELKEIEKKAREIKGAINTLCKLSGSPEMFTITDEQEIGSIANIRADTFYGKTISSAAREYLEMRRAANLGPATTRDIFDALVKGGFKFDTANDNNSMISLGSTLRKNSKVFHRLPTGQFGLLAWYPNAKAEKGGKETDDSQDETKSATDNEPVADEHSSGDAPINHHEEGASEPSGKEE